MKLRIIGGDLKRRVISLGERLAGFRPTRDRIREAVAESLKPRICGARVADLCAGSGAFGFEMLSRGARVVHFVESDRPRAAMIDAHARRFAVEQRCRVFVSDVARFLQRCRDTYDIIYFDPPYDVESLAALLPAVVAHVAEEGVCVYEHRTGDGFERRLDPPRGLEVRHRTYGRTRVDFVTPVARPVRDANTASRTNDVH